MDKKLTLKVEDGEKTTLNFIVDGFAGVAWNMSDDGIDNRIIISGKVSRIAIIEQVSKLVETVSAQVLNSDIDRRIFAINLAAAAVGKRVVDDDPADEDDDEDGEGDDFDQFMNGFANYLKNRLAGDLN